MISQEAAGQRSWRGVPTDVEMSSGDVWLPSLGWSRTVGTVSTADIEWLSTAESARRLGVTARTLYRFIDDGQLPAYRFGRVIRLKESEVADFIDRCRIVPGSLDDDEPAARDEAGGPSVEERADT